MKKLIVVFIVILAISGCVKDDNNYPAPVISFLTSSDFVSQDTVLKLGDQFKVGIDASNPNVNLTNFIIKVETDEFETFLDSGMNTPVLHYEKYLYKSSNDIEKWSFIIRDKDGKASEISFNVGLDTASTYGEIVYFQDIVLGAQNSSLSGFYSLEENLVYSLSDAFQNQEKIDLCYYYDFIDTDENTIASPGANIDESVFSGSEALANWSVRRTSRFKVVDVSEEDFLGATNDSLLIAAHGIADGNRKAKNMAIGKMYAFKNEDGRIGLFMVNSISGSDEGQVNISIKVQVK